MKKFVLSIIFISILLLIINSIVSNTNKNMATTIKSQKGAVIVNTNQNEINLSVYTSITGEEGTFILKDGASEVFATISNLSVFDDPTISNPIDDKYIRYNYIKLQNDSLVNLRCFLKIPNPIIDTGSFPIDNALKILIEQYDPDTGDLTSTLYNGWRQDMEKDPNDPTISFLKYPHILGPGDKLYFRFKVYYNTVPHPDPYFADKGVIIPQDYFEINHEESDYNFGIAIYRISFLGTNI